MSPVSSATSELQQVFLSVPITFAIFGPAVQRLSYRRELVAQAPAVALRVENGDFLPLLWPSFVEVLIADWWYFAMNMSESSRDFLSLVETGQSVRLHVDYASEVLWNE